MQYINHQPVPVYSSDEQPIMPCHPARARKLLIKGRAVPHHTKGLFGIRLLDRTRAQSVVQDVAFNIDPGSQTTGIAVVADDENGQRTVLAALEIKHRAVIKVKGTRVAVGKQSASIANGRIIARNPRHRIRWTTPSQQGHHDPDAVTLSAVAAA